MDGVLLMAGAMERERASSEKVSLNSLSLSLSFALIFIRTAKFDFCTASRGGAMKLGSCEGGAPSEELPISQLSLSLSCFDFYSHS
jgi:hypothetical protein